MYHTGGKISNLHGLAHVEHEYFASITLGTGFEHQLAGFRNEHEVANNLWMRNRDGASILDLFLEEWDNGTI